MGTRFRTRHVLLVVLGLLVALYVFFLGARVLWPIAYTDVILREAEALGVDPDLVGAVIYAESRFRADATSPRGAIGLMQLMPTTGRWIAEQLGLPTPTVQDLYNVDLNVHLGTWYLAQLLARYNDPELALSAYNAGPANVDRWQLTGEDPFLETANHVRRVQAARWIYRLYLRYPLLHRITPSLVF